ncbi:type II toxin-antitoxin system ParD family antitoxin [Rhizobium sp. CCGE532]|uniref:type II toxin-antitoxin system ParD family antitoxin n=1 Tax=unclassified Rhizobium TaxID=2613769 RepID=UPI0032AEA7DF
MKYGKKEAKCGSMVVEHRQLALPVNNAINSALSVIHRPDLTGEMLMNVSIGERWEKFVEKTVEEGRYSSASEVVREGLRLVEERETKIAALRHTLEASIARGGDISDEELGAALEAKAAELAKEGY